LIVRLPGSHDNFPWDEDGYLPMESLHDFGKKNAT